MHRRELRAESVGFEDFPRCYVLEVSFHGGNDRSFGRFETHCCTSKKLTSELIYLAKKKRERKENYSTPSNGQKEENRQDTGARYMKTNKYDALCFDL